nr:HTH domain-containing protein [Latilactobacillus sakei]
MENMPKTIRELADELNVSKQTIQKDIAKCLKKSIEQYLPIVKRQDIEHE